MKKNYIANRETATYLLVGILTTIVSWLAWIVASSIFDAEIIIENAIINTIGWSVGVCVAYPLNRAWVFRSKNKTIWKEFLEFVLSRISTWILEVLVMFFFVNVFSLKGLVIFAEDFFNLYLDEITIKKVSEWIPKFFIAAPLVVIFNYVLSKIYIFKQDTNQADSFVRDVD